MRRGIFPTALVLAVATGLALAELRLVALAPLDADGLPADAHANAVTVRRFYDAVNRTLLTGDAAPLDALLAPDFIEHTVRPGQSSDRSGLMRYLQALHRTAPSLVLIGHDLVAEGDRVSAHIQVDGASSTPAGGLPAIVGRPWGTIDAFRLRSGRIAEHWGDGLGLGLVEPLLAVGVEVEPPPAKWVEVVRLTYPSGGADWTWTSGPTVLLVEAGVLTVAHDPISPAAAELIPAATARTALPPDETATLAAGDALVFGRTSHFETRNNGETPATVLVVRSAASSSSGHGGPADAAPDAPPGSPAIGATVVALAGGFPALFPGDRAKVAIGRVALAPGAALARHPVALAEFVVVESGSLALTVESGTAWVRSRPGNAKHEVTDTPIADGAGLVVDAGATVAFAPAGSTPLVALVIAIGPTV